KGLQQSIYVQIRFMDAFVPSTLSPSKRGLPARREVKGFLWRTAVMASQIAGGPLWERRGGAKPRPPGFDSRISRCFNSIICVCVAVMSRTMLSQRFRVGRRHHSREKDDR